MQAKEYARFNILRTVKFTCAKINGVRRVVTANINPLAVGRQRLTFPAFRSRFPWIGGDLQTLRNTFMRPAPDFSPYPSERLTLDLDDGTGDSLWALANRPEKETGKPTIVLIHGLTGCETSRNIMVSAAHHLRQGFPVIRLNLRGAGPSLGLCKGHYHAGRSADIRNAIRAIPRSYKVSGFFVVGVSLGGNVVLKFLAEGAELDGVLGAASVCAPIDLKVAQRRIMAPRNAVYQRHLLQSMKQDAERWVGSHASDIRSTLPSIRSVYDFDDRIVAQVNGFGNAEEYYRQCSSKPLLEKINKPTLILHPRTDPWVPVKMYLDLDLPPDGDLTLVIPPDGGHVGFHDASERTPWHDRCIGRFISALVG